MNKAIKKQLCYAGGTLIGWTLARLVKSKETVPFTIMGGLAGFAVGESLIAEPKKKTLPTAPKVLSAVEGVPRKNKTKRRKTRNLK